MAGQAQGHGSEMEPVLCSERTVSRQPGTPGALCHAVKFRSMPGMSPQECGGAGGGAWARLGSSTVQGCPPASLVLGPPCVHTVSPNPELRAGRPEQAPLIVLSQPLRNQT